MNLKRIRIGSVVIGMKIMNEEHALMTRFLIGRVAYTAGVINRFLNTDKQVVFIDYDDLDATKVMVEVCNLMAKYDIRTMHMFQSDDSNHTFGISTELVDKQTVRNFLLDSHCDDKFIYVYCKNGDNTIRIAPKFVDKSYRIQHYLLTLTNPTVRGIHTYHKGLTDTLIRAFPETDTDSGSNMIFEEIVTTGDIQSEGRFDDSTMDDCIWKVYETIRW
jgi:hypothetical protein